MQNATKPVKSLARASEDVSNRTRPGGKATLKMIVAIQTGQQTFESSHVQSGIHNATENRTA